MEDKVIDIQELAQDRHNFNRGSEEGQQLMERSFKELGAGRSILLDRNGNIIAGNKSQKAAIAAGIKRVRVVETTGDELVAVKRTDVDIDSAEGRKMAYLDNLTTQVNLTWDETELQAVQADVEGFDIADFGFDIEDLPQVTFPTGEKQGEGEGKPQTEVKEDDFDPDAHYETKVKAGEVWQLGEHRLMCGDSTDADAVAKLMNGERADLALTDPPYGVAVVQNNQVGGDKPFGSKDSADRGDKMLTANRYAPIIGDETTETARKSYDIMKDVSANQVIFGGNYFTDFLQPKACWLVWDKENTGNFADVELAWTSFDKGAKLYRWLWNGLCRKGDRDTELVKRVHPTQKPVGMLGAIIQDFTKDGAVILDLFGGSGSTLIACQQLNRKCLMMEMSVEYCAIIIARWEQFTKQKAVKL